MHDDADIVLAPHPDTRGSTRARRGAGLFDVFVVPLAVSGAFLLLGQDGAQASRIAGPLLLLMLALPETLGGASPGKVVAGLQVERADGTGRRPDLVRAVLRRPWAVVLALEPLLDQLGPGVGNVQSILTLAVLLAMLVSIDRSPDGRGFHDRLLDTRVVAGPERATARIVVIAVCAALALVAAVAPGATTTTML